MTVSSIFVCLRFTIGKIQNSERTVAFLDATSRVYSSSEIPFHFCIFAPQMVPMVTCHLLSAPAGPPPQMTQECATTPPPPPPSPPHLRAASPLRRTPAALQTPPPPSPLALRCHPPCRPRSPMPSACPPRPWAAAEVTA